MASLICAIMYGSCPSSPLPSSFYAFISFPFPNFFLKKGDLFSVRLLTSHRAEEGGGGGPSLCRRGGKCRSVEFQKSWTFSFPRKRRRRRRWSARQTGFKRGRGKEEVGQANTNFPRAVLKEKLLGGGIEGGGGGEAVTDMPKCFAGP